MVQAARRPNARRRKCPTFTRAMVSGARRRARSKKSRPPAPASEKPPKTEGLLRPQDRPRRQKLCFFTRRRAPIDGNAELRRQRSPSAARKCSLAPAAALKPAASPLQRPQKPSRPRKLRRGARRSSHAREKYSAAGADRRPPWERPPLHAPDPLGAAPGEPAQVPEPLARYQPRMRTPRSGGGKPSGRAADRKGCGAEEVPEGLRGRIGERRIREAGGMVHPRGLEPLTF